MGANFSTAKFNEKDAVKLRKAYQSYVQELQYQYGHDGYNGTLATCRGLDVKERLFKTFGEAEEWLVENTSKWGEAVAVKVFTPSKAFKDTAKGKALTLKKEQANKAYWDAVRGVLLTEERSKLEKQKGKVEAKYREAHAKYIDAQFNKVTKSPKKFVWLVGGWCAE